MGADLKAPFPWFGGKSRVSDLVWSRFGDVANYVEPFAGSLAVLLGRPSDPGIETVNDLDCMVANFWRALKADPDAVASAADWPVNEADQHARHLWLCSQAEFRERMKVEPEYYDAKIAGWWVWGQCIWIGSGWCAAQLPHLGDAGTGVHRKRPHLGDAGTGDEPWLTRSALRDYMHALAARLRSVRVSCGDWSRICGPSPTVKIGLTGVFLDPPYSDEDSRAEVYASDSGTVAHDVKRGDYGDVGNGVRFTSRDCGIENTIANAQLGCKQRGSGGEWWRGEVGSKGSKSNARKAASAQIAKIPLVLSRHIARAWWPDVCARF